MDGTASGFVHIAPTHKIHGAVRKLLTVYQQVSTTRALSNMARQYTLVFPLPSVRENTYTLMQYLAI